MCLLVAAGFVSLIWLLICSVLVGRVLSVWLGGCLMLLFGYLAGGRSFVGKGLPACLGLL